MRVRVPDSAYFESFAFSYNIFFGYICVCVCVYLVLHTRWALSAPIGSGLDTFSSLFFNFFFSPLAFGSLELSPLSCPPASPPPSSFLHILI